MTRRHLQIALGIIWLLDGLLQLQPKMFTPSFANNVILPAAAGQPAFVSAPVHWAVSIFLLQPVIFNSLIVLTQLTIGALIIYKRTIKYGLMLSIIWGLFVWGIGESYGGIFSGQFSLLMGAPGAAVLYSILSVAAYPARSIKTPAPWLAFIWSSIWILGAVLLVTQQQSAGNVHGMIVANAQGAPSWLSDFDGHIASFVGGSGSASVAVGNSSSMSGMAMTANSTGYWLILAFSLIGIFVAVGVYMNKVIRYLSIATGTVLLVLLWIIGQNAGGYYSGLMTDLNTAPLFILLGASLTKSDLKRYLMPLRQRVEKVLI